MVPVGTSSQAPILAVGAVLFDGAGRVLLVRRGRAPAAGTWSLPGGRVHEGEALDAAIVREVLEETAIEARVACALCVVDTTAEATRFAIHEHLLEPIDPAAVPQPGDDAAEARWVSPSEMAGLGVTAAVLDVIAGARIAAAGKLPSFPTGVTVDLLHTKPKVG